MAPQELEQCYSRICDGLKTIADELQKVDCTSDYMARTVCEYMWDCRHLSEKVWNKCFHVTLGFKPFEENYSEKEWQERTLEKRIINLSLTREVGFLYRHILDIEELTKEEYPKLFKAIDDLQEDQQKALGQWIL